MKAIEKIREVAGIFQNSGFESPDREAELLISGALDISILDIYTDNPELERDSIRTFEDMLERRLTREPSQYITGYEEFMGLKLAVGPGVLIPRPETEIMAEYAIKKVESFKLEVKSENKISSIVNPVKGRGPNGTLRRQSSISILDVCTGCGCLALALAKEFPDSMVFGTDISDTAVAYAKRNAEINGINNVTFLQGDLFEPVEKLSTFDLIISNPPYIKTGEIKGLQPEIRDWEPLTALDGGEDGLDHYGNIIPAARKFLKDKGMIMLEIGQGQADDIADIMSIAGYEYINVIKDYAGIKRIIKAQCKR
ncbi:MAG TPA: peptide chain release factor N(5)-glutamine methyltransferase [Nitrospirae bacterium]|nr:peptide chain release factor N(5)-glutamine methyltransferase [Nitrospirota bacterium]